MAASSAPSTGGYTYGTLEDGHVRVLRLLPSAESSADLEAVLEPVDLGAKPRFEALSYVWGAPAFSETLHIDGCQFKITKNLELALRRFRLPTEPRILWADAVCINQADMGEKARQIPLMGRIYGTAETVLAWLGDDAEDADRPIDEAKIELAGAFAFVGLGIFRPGSIYLLDNLPTFHAEANSDARSGRWAKSFELANMDDKLNPWGLRRIYESAWFTRVWTVQEAALAKKLVLHIGRFTLKWSEFERMCVLIYIYVESQHRFDPKAWENFMAGCWPLVQMVHKQHKSRSTRKLFLEDWFKWLVEASSRQCSEDRDRVYGYLGLLPEGIAALMKPDYTKSVEEVYADVARIAAELGMLKHLYSAGFWRRPKYLESPGAVEQGYLPSWAPDYRYLRANDLEVGWIQNGYADEDIVDKNRATHTKISMTTDPRSIAIMGVVAGSVDFAWDFSEFRDLVRSHGKEAEHKPSREDIMKELRRLLAAVESKYGRVNPVFKDESWTLATLSALIRAQDIASLWPVYAGMAKFEPGEYSYLEYLREFEKIVLDGGSSPSKYFQAMQLGFIEGLRTTFQDFNLFITTIKFAGITPRSSAGCRLGDNVAFVDGGNVPLLLRTDQTTKAQTIIGPCNLYGVSSKEVKALEMKSEHIFCI